MQFVDLKTQYQRIQTQVESNIKAVFEHGGFIMGPEVAQLEAKLSEFVGAQYCIGVASGTDALIVALMALDIQPGDEIITTPFSFISTAETISLLGAKPVFVDIDPQTYNIDTQLIESAITSRTRGIIPVSLYGQCADFDAINDIANEYNLPVIEDAAQSLGATYKNRHSCNLSTIGCTSFFPTKPLGGYGDGGACFTNDAELAETMQAIRKHGQTKKYHHPRLGLNARLDTLQAAALLPKLEIFEDEIERRQRVAAYYEKVLPSTVTPPYIASHNKSVYGQYTIQVDNRDELQAALKEASIPTAVHYPTPLHKQPIYLSFDQSLPVSETIAQRVISLPFHAYLEQKNIDQIATIIKKILPDYNSHLYK